MPSIEDEQKDFNKSKQHQRSDILSERVQGLYG